MLKTKNLLAAAMCILLFLTTACADSSSPETVTGNFFNALKESDLSKAKKYVVNTDIEGALPDKEIAKLILAKIEYKITETSINGDKATVKADITAPDMMGITASTVNEMIPLAFATVFSAETSPEEIDKLVDKYLINSISDDNAPMTTTQTNINLVKTKGGWKISQANDELYRAITGNALKAFEILETENKY